jgi:hypothetical protein
MDKQAEETNKILRIMIFMKVMQIFVGEILDSGTKQRTYILQ